MRPLFSRLDPLVRPLACAIAMGMGLCGAAPASHAADTVLLPVADTYVRNSQATTAFGTATTIESNNANGVRVILLRFDLRGITRPITNLRMNLTMVTGGGNVFQVFGVTSGENWDEATTSWSTSPGVKHSFTALAGNQVDYLDTTTLANSGTAFTSFTTASSGTITLFDVSTGSILDFVNADADKIVTFLIAEADPTDNGGDRFNSREATSGQPTLTVSTSEPVLANGTTLTALRVVLVGGQSNGDGRALATGLPATLQAPQSNVPLYYYTYNSAANSDGTLGTLTTLRTGASQMPAGAFGPEITMGYYLAPFIERQPGTALAVIKFAQGGTSLYADWKPDGTSSATADGASYQTFQKVVTAGLARLRAGYPGVTVTLAGMIWTQGETDIGSGSASASAYAANLTKFIADVRATFCPTLPFFLSRISDQQTSQSLPSDSSYSNYLIVRDQQAQVAANVPNSYLINTDGAAFEVGSDGTHYDYVGQQALGAAFAKAMSGVLPLSVTQTRQNGSMSLQWNAIAGKRYRVQTSNDLVTWTSQDVGMTSSWSESVAAARRFYRVSEMDDTL